MTTTAPPAAVNTKRVAGRRTLRFDTLDQALAEAEGIAAAEQAGALKRLGNWTPGMMFAHVAAFASYPYDGYPDLIAHPPWLAKIIFKPLKKRILSKTLPAGVWIPKVPGGTIGADDVPAEEGLRRLRAAFERLKKAPPSAPNVIFGPMTHAEWIAMQCRHAELHFSFLVY